MGLAEIKSPSEAISLLVGCETRSRTLFLSYENNSESIIVLSFAQFKDESGNILDGYIDDTGVFVGVTNLGPHSRANNLDPCPLCGKFKPIQANTFKSMTKLRLPDGSEIDLPYDDHAEPGDYLTSVTLSVNSQGLDMGITGKSTYTSKSG